MPIFSLNERRVEFRGANHYIAPGAQLAGAIVLDDEVNIWFNVVIRADNDRVLIGAQTNIQDGSVLHVDPGFPLTVGRRCTVGHKVMLHGCTIGDGTLVGINSVIMNGARIGAGSLIGANSLVAEGKEIPPGVLAVGSPAQVRRDLKPEEKERILWASANYVERAQRYASELRPQSFTGDPA